FSIFVYEESPVSIKIIDSLGREVKTILNKKFLGHGQYDFSWDGQTNSNETAGSGMYYIKFESDEDILSEKLLLIH
ncbi:MAG: FlgD immunoglobulin-like domain containing protein, partial [Candidatus Marinimicrobia bacterium]|nr:FlgD immunoglobulin-like domain containing protein [Candidatus Neomarinimicrobiota bacterium]